MGFGRRVGAMLGGVLASCLFASPAESRSEYQIKAAYLINVARFVEWLAPESKPAFHFCLVGRDPFGEILGDLVAGKTINNRPLQIRRIAGMAELESCDVVFLPASEMYRFNSLAASLAGRSVLTVGEAKGFAARGGVVNLVTEQEHVRMEINPEAAARAHLKVSSRLLQLAKVVTEGF
jgi:hypothetical protein